MPFLSEETMKSLRRRKALPELTGSVEFVSSGLYAYDYATGGGFPRKRLTEVAGRNHTAKTTLFFLAAAKIMENGGYVCLIETERSLDLGWMARLGIPESEIYSGEEDREMEACHLHVWHPPYLESGLETLLTLHRENVYDIICMDSFGGSPVRAAAEGSMDDVVMMKRARVAGTFKEKFMAVADEGNAAVVMTNHVYTNTNQNYYDKLKPEGGFIATPGGEQIAFVASIRTYMETPGKLENGEKQITGKLHKGMIYKNKVGRSVPQRFEFQIRDIHTDDPYISVPYDIWSMALKVGIIEKRGHYWFLDDNNIASSDIDLENKIIQDNELSAILETRLAEAIRIK